MRRMSPALLLLLLLPQASPLERYLAEPDPKARAALLPQISGGLSEVEAELRRPPLRPAPEAVGRVVRKTLTPAHPAGAPFEYALWVPAGYTPEKRWRLIVSLHGQSGNGPDFMRHWLPDLQRAGDAFLLCPSAGRGGWGRSLLGHRHVLDPLQDVLSSYAVDPDLVFLDGASMGGNGSFEFVCLYPDLFAGAAPRSGGPLFRTVKKGSDEVVAEGLGMLLATPIYWTVGAKDAKLPNAWVRTAKSQLDALKTDFTFVEHPEGGHEWFPQENPRILAWMGEKRRRAYPPRVGLETQERAFARAFWLEISEWKGKELIKRNFTDVDRQVIEERPAFLDMARVVAELVPAENGIRILSTGPVKELRLHLHAEMLDLSRPVKVVVNGSASSHAAKPSVQALLESAVRDRGLLYPASVKVQVR
jgi:dienelactone hydrolase